jgi:anaerobic magnesium-protoporphyrin IX monomethyl ester cyclase
MKIMLVNPPDQLEAMLGAGSTFIQKYEPLGLLYVAAVARELGHEIRVIDAYAEELDCDQVTSMIEDYAPDVLGFSVLTCHGSAVWSMGKQLKDRYPELLVILGNVHAAEFAQQYVEEGCADVVVHGEGEPAIGAILEAFEGDGDYSNILGITYRAKGGRAERNAGTNVVDDLAALPFPARDLVHQSKYQLTNISNQNYVTRRGDIGKTMVTSRGCPFRCTFCVVHGGRKPRMNEPERVVEEMELMQEVYGCSYVYIQDPLFMADRRRVEEICRLHQERGLTLKWGADAHVNTIRPEVVRALEAGGCFELSLGIETGTQRLLDTINKRTKLENITKAAHCIKDNSDIAVEGLFILGLPGETEFESNETIRYACSLPIDMAQFSVLTPYPGSPIFEQLRAEDGINTGIRPDGSVDPSVWHRYTAYICFNDVQPIWTTPTQSADSLRRLQKKALRKFYLRPKQLARQARRIRPHNIKKMADVALQGFF